MREGVKRENDPIFAIDVIYNLRFLIDTGPHISIIRKDCVHLERLGAVEEIVNSKKAIVGITGGWAVNFKTSVELQIKLVDLNNRMGTKYGKFMINASNIMDLDILSKALIIINGQNGTWNFKKSKSEKKSFYERGQ